MFTMRENESRNINLLGFLEQSLELEVFFLRRKQNLYFSCSLYKDRLKILKLFWYVQKSTDLIL
jgi:hypothetical protein